MKKIIRLTESDLTRIVKRVIMEQNQNQVELFTDSSLTQSLGFYEILSTEGAAGTQYVNLQPTPNAKKQCVEGIKMNDLGNRIFGDDCKFETKVFLNDAGKMSIQKAKSVG